MWSFKPALAWLLTLPLSLTPRNKETPCLVNGQKRLQQERHHDVERIVMTAWNQACTSGQVRDEDSYYITAKGDEYVYCLLRFNDMDDGAVLRLGAPLVQGETIQIIGNGYNVSVTPQSPLYGCYLLMGGPFQLLYTKQANIQPNVELLLTSAECPKPTERCEVTCRTDTCVMPTYGCSAVCIDDDYRCDRYQQCPYGEDESCGQITTVTPMTDQTTTRPTGTTLVPSHIRTIIVGPQMPGCTGATVSYFNQEMIVTNLNQPKWAGKCTFKFVSTDRGIDDDDLAVLRLEGQLGHSESILIGGGTGKFTLDYDTKAGECYITTGSFTLTYQSHGASTGAWRLVSTPIDCDEDDYCMARCSTSACHQGGRRPCKRSGCIRDINFCDGVQQCPKGEDESCGQITTIVPPRRGLSHGYIVLIVLVVVAILAALAVAGIFFMRKSRRQPKDAFGGMSAMDHYPQPTSVGISAPASYTVPQKKDASQTEENIYEVA